MGSPPFEGLKATLAAMPPGSLVPRDWVLDQLERPQGAEGAADPPARLVDLSIRDLARLFGKRPSTVRAWVERGDFPAAYKLNRKEWRVPPSSLAAFQTRQRNDKQDSTERPSSNNLSDWRKAR